MVENRKTKGKKNNPPNHDFVQIKRQKDENEDDYVAVHYISRGFGLNAVEGMNKKKTPICWNQILKSLLADRFDRNIKRKQAEPTARRCMFVVYYRIQNTLGRKYERGHYLG